MRSAAVRCGDSPSIEPTLLKRFFSISFVLESQSSCKLDKSEFTYLSVPRIREVRS